MRSVPSLDTRKACAYRLHIIESALPAHVIATMLAIITPVVSKLRYPDEFALFDKVPWLEFREVFAVVSFVCIACAHHCKTWYIAHYETASNIMNTLGMLARCTMSMYRPSMPWRFIRVISVVASSIGMRYELRRQWRAIVLRLAAAGVIDAYVKVKRDGTWEIQDALHDACITELAVLAFYTPLCLGMQLWLERIDAKAFEAKWRETESAVRGRVRNSVEVHAAAQRRSAWRRVGFETRGDGGGQDEDVRV